MKKILRKDKYIFFLCDAIILSISVIASFWLRFGEIDNQWFYDCFWMIPTTTFICLINYSITGQYKGITKYLGSKIFYNIILRNILSITIIAFTGIIFQLNMPPRGVWFLILIILCSSEPLVRIIARDLLRYSNTFFNRTPNVLIYGAGSSGAQLESSLRLTGTYKVRLFLDEDPSLWGQTLNGLPIKSPSELKFFIDKIDLALLANPSENRAQRNKLLEEMQRQGVPALQIPSIKDITSGKAIISDLKPIFIEDLLGRDRVEPNVNLIQSEIEGSIICVTGAGGSIGSELSEQILKYKPKKLVLIEWNETNLYTITEKLNEKNLSCKSVVPVLGNIQDFHFILGLIKKHKIEYIFHTAAYKHVPIIERNPIQGLLNNVFATKSLCQASKESNIKKFILISSDKAVRPINIMGATKRLSEMIVQMYASESSGTCFSMVRFGNVLNSSGSVVPLFKEQIAKGGPITVTHPEMIRYFMTIKEASELVLHSASLSVGGEVFLLDMGEPVKIKDLARQMINLSGLSVKDLSNPNGDIGIEYIGIRPGEKLYEELLIDSNSEKTAHPLIFKANEKLINPKLLINKLNDLEIQIEKLEESESIKILRFLIPELPKSLQGE